MRRAWRWGAAGSAATLLVTGPTAAQDATPQPEASAVTTGEMAASSPLAAIASPTWIATLSSGVLARDGDAARPFGVAGLSRKLGRGYVRVTVTGFESVLRQFDATLPSSFALASLGAGGTFGNWFVDGSASAGRQFYGGVTTSFGTRASQVGSGSGVYGASLDGGRFVRLARRFYLTPSVAVQYSEDRALRSSLAAMGPREEETAERAWTGGATVRLDRFFGPDSRHVAGVSVSRVQTTNGAVAATTAGGAAPTLDTETLGDGWFVVGASSSLRVARRLWLDGAGTRTIGARTGDYATLSLGVRFGF